MTLVRQPFPISFTPATSWVSNVTWTGSYTDNGVYQSIIMRGLLTGAPTATDLSITIPNGKEADGTNWPISAGGRLRVGCTTMLESSVTWYAGTVFVTPGSATLTFCHLAQSGATLIDMPAACVSSTIPFTWGNNDEINICIPFLPVRPA